MNRSSFVVCMSSKRKRAIAAILLTGSLYLAFLALVYATGLHLALFDYMFFVYFPWIPLIISFSYWLYTKFVWEYVLVQEGSDRTMFSYNREGKRIMRIISGQDGHVTFYNRV